MSEKIIQFKTDDAITIEGLYRPGPAGEGVVITHPHPLYGGDMYNIVVETIQKAYENSGYATLRFNFRGTGRSGGEYDDGNGEQQDLLAACRFIEDTGVSSFHLAGYSFGAWVNAKAKASNKLPSCSMTMVSPPAAMLGFPPDLQIPSLKLVVTGSEDEFAPPSLVKGLANQWNPSARFEVIQGADHFFWGYTQDLENILKAEIKMAS